MNKLAEQFEAVSSDVDDLFSSFETLQEVFKSGINNIEKSASSLPYTVNSSVDNFMQVLNGTDKSVALEQKKISAKLYNQGLVLLYGSSESLLREMFRSLVRNNLDKVKIKDNVVFTFTEIEQTLGNEAEVKFEDLVLGKLEDEKSPAEKLNFQNMQQMAGILKGYFNLLVEDKGLIKKLHLYWQNRHLIIHNSGVIDKKFIDNLKVAGISTKNYNIGERIKIDKDTYEDCKNALFKLFDTMDAQIKNNNLKLGD